MKARFQQLIANMQRSAANFMVGRYGADQLSRFLSIVSLVLLVLGCFFSRILYFLGLGVLLYSYFRVFSRNYAARSTENTKFLTLQYRWNGWLAQKKKRFSQRKVYRYYRCPHCKQELRVPRGRGRISITCPKCSMQFIKKT